MPPSMWTSCWDTSLDCESTKVAIPMVDIIERIASIERPGVYVTLDSLKMRQFDDHITLKKGNINPRIVDRVTDRMARYLRGMGDRTDVFLSATMGAMSADRLDECISYLVGVKDSSDTSILNAMKVISFEGGNPPSRSELDDVRPDADTCGNIRVMIRRARDLLDLYGPIIMVDFQFLGGYTSTITKGQGDILTRDSIMTIDVSDSPPDERDVLSLIVQYLMGERSVSNAFDGIERIMVLNPRLNRIYYTYMSEIGHDVLERIGEEVIGYNRAISLI